MMAATQKDNIEPEVTACPFTIGPWRHQGIFTIFIRAGLAEYPQGVHPLIWEGINSEPFVLPEDKPLTLASYVAGPGTTAYVDPVAVGDRLPEMPVFLDTKTYVRVPLAETYDATWKTCPEEFRQRVTGGNGSS